MENSKNLILGEGNNASKRTPGEKLFPRLNFSGESTIILRGLLINQSILGVQDQKPQTDNTCTHLLMTALSLDQW